MNDPQSKKQFNPHNTVRQSLAMNSVTRFSTGQSCRLVNIANKTGQSAENCIIYHMYNFFFCTFTVPKKINFPRYKMKCSGENVILRGIFHVGSRFSLLFMLYRLNLDSFLYSQNSLSLSQLQNLFSSFVLCIPKALKFYLVSSYPNSKSFLSTYISRISSSLF